VPALEAAMALALAPLAGGLVLGWLTINLDASW
jgi:hypothetical protein